MDDNLFQLLLFDRVEKIKTENKKFDFENNAYLSFSGGKDSTVLHHLIDMALPNNNIPRLFINTGIEHKDIRAFVKKLKEKDKRVNIINSNQNFKEMFKKYGYPFKSKQHSHNLSIYQNSGMTLTNEKYLGLKNDKPSMYQCPNILKYQFTEEFKIKCSDKCCYKLKKEPAHKWSKENNRSIVITGMRKQEGGNRNNLNCTVFEKGNLKKFHPLAPLDNDFMEWFIKEYDIKLCELYYPPYNFKRTGCKGCPFALDLQKQLDIMEELLPNEKKQCEILWKDVYIEYRRLNYRLKEIPNINK